MAIGSWQSGGLSILNLLPNHCPCPLTLFHFQYSYLSVPNKMMEFYIIASSFIFDASLLPIETSVDSNKGDRQLHLG